MAKLRVTTAKSARNPVLPQAGPLLMMPRRCRPRNPATSVSAQPHVTSAVQRMNVSGFVKKALLVFFFGLIFISFSLFGVGDILRGGGDVQIVASVGDAKITQQDYARRFSREYSRLQRQFGNRFTIQNAEAIGLPRSVLDRMIAERLFQAQADDLGLAVSDERVRQEIFQNEVFKDQLGQFSRDRYNQVLRSLQQSEEQFVTSLRGDIKRSQLARAVSDGVDAPEALVEQVYAFENEARVADYIRIAESGVALTKAATEEDLRSYHEDFSESFMAPAYRDVTVLTLTPDQMIDQIDVSEEDLREEYEASLEDLGVPEKRQLQQAVFDSEEQAQAFFDKLKGGQSFAVALQEFNGKTPNDLGEVSRTELSIVLPEAVDKAFSLDVGEVSEPIRSALGWHVVHVQDVAPGSTPDFAEVRDQLRQDVTMRRAVDEMIALANEVDDQLAGGATLEEVAASLALNIETFDGISREGNNRQGEEIESLPSSERFLDIAFSTEVGEQSLLTETENGGYFVLRVDGVTPPQVRPLSEVRAEVERRWLQDQREQKAREIAEGYAERLRGGGAEIAEIAEQEGVSVQQTQPLTRTQQGPSADLVSQLFELEVGEVAVAGGEAAQYVAVLREIRGADPSSDSEGLQEVADRLNQDLSGELLALYSNDLQQRFGVTINDAAIQDVLSGY